jgi:P4 family phage/plasmid primase-like protien
MIPEQLKECRFVKILFDSKKPVEENWPDKNNYAYDSPELKEWTTNGNYGVLCGTNNLTVVDIDFKSPNFEKALFKVNELPQTFTVQTPGGGHHFYYIIKDIESSRLKNQVGEIRNKGMCVVGPNSQIGEKKYFVILKIPKTETPKETDQSRSGKEFGIVCRKILQGKTKEKTFEEMQLYSKWATAPPQYREMTYEKALIHAQQTPTRKQKETKEKIKDPIAEEFFRETEFIPARLGEEILSRTPIKTLKGSNHIYRYIDGVYRDDGKEHIKTQCAQLLGEEFNRYRQDETINYIQANTYITADNINNNYINLENGLLNPETNEFIEHTPDIFSIIRIPIAYDPLADCPLWKQKLSEKIDQQTIQIVQEMFGYCYLPGQKFQKAFLLYGPMRTMKSTTLHILGKMLGEENVSANSLQFISENSFAKAYLYSKTANIYADLSPKNLHDTSDFMTITGGDKISAAKKREHQIDFYPTTKLIFSCNHVPSTSNKNLAFYRRWIILEFKKQTAQEEIDETLWEKLEIELPGILNWALEGLKRLIENRKFSYWLDEMQIKDLYEKSSDSVQSFIYNKIDSENDEGSIKKRDVYAAYKAYCEEQEIRTENNIYFGKVFLSITGCGVGKSNGIPTYKGVSFKDGSKAAQDDYNKPLAAYDETKKYL